MRTPEQSSNSRAWEAIKLLPGLCAVTLAAAAVLLSEPGLGQRPEAQQPAQARAQTRIVLAPTTIAMPSRAIYIVDSDEQAGFVHAIEGQAQMIAFESGILSNHAYLVFIVRTADDDIAARAVIRERTMASSGDHTVAVHDLRGGSCVDYFSQLRQPAE